MVWCVLPESPSLNNCPYSMGAESELRGSLGESQSCVSTVALCNKRNRTHIERDIASTESPHRTVGDSEEQCCGWRARLNYFNIWAAVRSVDGLEGDENALDYAREADRNRFKGVCTRVLRIRVNSIRVYIQGVKTFHWPIVEQC